MGPEQLVYDGLQRCPYLPGRVARLPLFRQLRRLTLEEADVRFGNAERRVGNCLYRTACPTCSECKGIRVCVDSFAPSRSQRRVWRRWEDRVRVEYSAPAADDERLRLFNAHKSQRGLTDLDGTPMNDVGYRGWLVATCMLTFEMRYFLGDRLVGVGVLDAGAESLSSVYFYFDPDPEVARMSPGVYSALREIELCKRTGRKYLYLGLHVEGCRHLAYKHDYAPNERLVGGRWRPHRVTGGDKASGAGSE